MGEKQTTRPALVTRRELAKRLNANPRSVSRWLEEGAPVVDRGKGGHAALFDEGAVRAWLRTRETTPASARVRFEVARAAECEQRVAQRAGQLISVEAVEKGWAAIVSAVRAKLLALPTTLADRLHRASVQHGAAGIEAVLEEAVFDTLHELAAGEEPKPKRKAGKARPAKRAAGTRGRQHGGTR